MVRTVLTGAVNGVEGSLITTEIDVADGLPCIDMVGNLSHEVKETVERVRVALKNVGYHLPPKRVTINLSPASIRKGGTGFDLPIAIGILANMGVINLPDESENGRDEPKEASFSWMAIGELSLDGSVRSIPGILPIIMKAKEEGIKTCILPIDNCKEACFIKGIQIIGVDNIYEVMEFFEKEGWNENMPPYIDVNNTEISSGLHNVDFSDIIGQRMAKRAAEIAAAGFHNLLLSGPPGTGKSMIASAISGILPPMNEDEMLETSKVYSVAGELNNDRPFIMQRPFQSPHHTITAQALVGGGNIPKPGIISMANRGVLFLDELPEFKRQTLDLLRQPLEEGKITIMRRTGSYQYPCDFMLVSAMNPCPCGYYPNRNYCNCSEKEVHNYVKSISGPLLNRIDLCVSVVRSEYAQMKQKDVQEETSEEIRAHVMKAREIQGKRNGENLFNGRIPSNRISEICVLSTEAEKLVEKYYNSKNLSMRGYHRMLRVARTIADLEGEEVIDVRHIAEAASYRGMLDG